MAWHLKDAETCSPSEGQTFVPFSVWQSWGVLNQRAVVAVTRGELKRECFPGLFYRVATISRSEQSDELTEGVPLVPSTVMYVEVLLGANIFFRIKMFTRLCRYTSSCSSTSYNRGKKFPRLLI